MYVSFSRVSGPYELDDGLPTKASTAIAVGDVCDNAGSGLQPGDAGDLLVALALQAKSSGDATQNSIQTLLLIGGRAKFYGVAEAGTFDREDDGAISVDLNSADGLAADTSTQKDWNVLQVMSSTQALGRFAKLAVG